MKTLIAKQLRKPSGILGFITGKQLAKQNIFTYQAIEKYYDFADAKKIFEIGYGPGAGLRYFADKYGASIDGVDFSRIMHKAATRRNKAWIASKKINLRHDNFLTMENPKIKYDCVYFANVTYFWHDLAEPFSKIFAMIQENGKLVFYMTNNSFLEDHPVTQTEIFNKHSYADVKRILFETGFENIQHHRVMSDTDDFLIIEATKKTR